MIRLFARWRCSRALDRIDRLADALRADDAASDLVEVDVRLRRDVPRARAVPSPDLRRRILRAVMDAPDPAPTALPPLRPGRVAIGPALAALAALMLLVAALAPVTDRRGPERASLAQAPAAPAPGPAADPPPARSEPWFVERLLKAPARPTSPRLPVPLVSEARFLVEDARDATEYVLEHIPERYRPRQ